MHCGIRRALVRRLRQMRIGVIGLGAIGGVTAQRLLGVGLDVALAAGRHAVEMADKFPQARVGATLPGTDPYGLILLCVRSPEIETALTPAVPLLKPDAAARREVRSLALRIIGEVVQAAQARAVKMEPIAGIRPDALVKLPAPVAHASIWLAAQLRPSQKSGMIARLQQGRPSGVEDLNALIDGPLNRALVRQVQEIETGQRPISPQNLAELS